MHHPAHADLAAHAEQRADVPVSGLMVGLGETDSELLATMRDLRAHDVDVLTIGQYLAPSRYHMPVRRYVPPTTFDMLRDEGLKMGFVEVVAGPLVRSSYHADRIAGKL
jgi:lipoic acid synthetase